MSVVVFASSDASAAATVAALESAGVTYNTLTLLEDLHRGGLPDAILWIEPFAGQVQPAAAGSANTLLQAQMIERLEAVAMLAPTLIINARPVSQALLLILMRCGIQDVIAEPSAASVAEFLRRAERQARGDHTLNRRQQRQLQLDQQAGRFVQRGMLPVSPLTIDGYRLAHKVWPSLLLSGDCVDYFRLDERFFAFYVADVAGHGASSAFVTVLLKSFLRRLQAETQPHDPAEPGAIMARLNAELLDNTLDKHVAIVFGIVDTLTNNLRLTNAGHFPPAIVVRRGQAKYLEQPNKPVGLFPGQPYESLSQPFLLGDHLIVLSDGVLERLDDRSLAAKEARLLAAASDAGGSCDGLFASLGIDPRQPSTDDSTWFAMTRER